MPLHLDTKIFNPSLYAKIRSVWFVDVPSNATASPQAALKRWYGLGGPDAKASFDNVCHENFRAALDSVSPDRLELPAAKTFVEEKGLSSGIAQPFLEQIRAAKDPEKPASTALSLVLLLDQIPRNVFRDDQRLIYSHYDRLSRALIHAMLSEPASSRWDLAPEYKYSPVYRSWFYLPLMHSEHIEDHEKWLELTSSSKNDVQEKGDTEAVADVVRNEGFEHRHFDIIKQFGHYPHRNDVMGRDWTTEEREWMEKGGDTFGTG